jgi:hypothetical protein
VVGDCINKRLALVRTQLTAVFFYLYTLLRPRTGKSLVKNNKKKILDFLWTRTHDIRISRTTTSTTALTTSVFLGEKGRI